jgi:hypothetical protein
METFSYATKADSFAENCHGRDWATIWAFHTYSDCFIHNLLRIVEPRLHKNVSTSFKDGGQADYSIGYSE